MCTVCIFLSACSGGWNLDDIEEEDLDDYQMGVVMDNVKVLRRSYSDDKATNAAISTSNLFYENYVSDIVEYLTYVYGILNTDALGESEIQIFTELGSKATEIGMSAELSELLTQLSTDYTNNKDEFKYYYDAMRYQITGETAYYKPKWKKSGEEVYSSAATMPEGYETNTSGIFSNAPTGMTQAELEASEFQYYEVVMDTSKGWNWGLSDNIASVKSFLYEIDQAAGYGTTNFAGSSIKKYKLNQEDYLFRDASDNGFYGYYTTTTYESTYGIAPFDRLKYISLIHDTKQPTEEGAVPTDFQKALAYVVYSIVNNEDISDINIGVEKTATGNVFAVEGYTTVDKALEAAKKTYADNASYVGLTESDQEKLIDYILNNVIGSAALEQAKTAKTEGRYDLHYEELVTAVVSYCASLTATGVTFEEDGTTVKSQTTIGGQYLSSDIKDYEYNSSYVNADETGFDEFAHLGEYEYQSMLLMPTNDSKIDEIWLDFGYYGNGGTNDSITIRTYIRNYVGGGKVEIIYQDIHIQEGVVQVGEDGTTLMFDFSDTKDGYLKADKINFDDAMNSKYYQERIKGTRPLNSYSREIVIGNTTEAREYYSLVEGAYRDYGVFNHEMLSGTEYYDKCYVEIAFEVISATCDNYKFYCGFAVVGEYQEEDYSDFQ